MPLSSGGRRGAPHIDLLDLFGRFLLVKEAGGPLQIRDIAADTLRWAWHSPHA